MPSLQISSRFATILHSLKRSNLLRYHALWAGVCLFESESALLPDKAQGAEIPYHFSRKKCARVGRRSGAIVTGASGGVGQAIAERLDREGAAAVVNYGSSADKAKAVVEAVAMTNQA